MKLLFAVDVMLDVPDELVAKRLGVASEDLGDVTDFDSLALGDFVGDLALVDPADPRVDLLGFVTQDAVTRVG